MPKDFEEKINFDRYIYKVLKQVHPDKSINNHAKLSVNAMLHDVARDICERIGTLVRDNGKKTITSREVQTAVRLIMSGELANHAVSEGTNAVVKYTSSASGTKAKPASAAIRSGLQFHPSRAKLLIKKYVPGVHRVGIGAPIYLAGVLEYLTAEVLELAGDVARHNQKTRVDRDHLMLAIKNDEDLSRVFKGDIVMGDIPKIHSYMLPRK